MQLRLNLVSFIGPVQHLSILLECAPTWTALVVCLIALVDDAVLGLAIRCLSLHQRLIVVAALQSDMLKVLTLVWFHL